MTRSAGGADRLPLARSRMVDVARAYIAIVLGFVLGYLAGYYVERLAPIPYAVALMVYVGPFAFLLLLFGYRSPDRRVSAARLIGAFVGWSVFISVFYVFPGTDVYLWVVAIRVPSVVLLSVSLLAAVLVALALVAADIAWARLQRMLSHT